jgi:hypothetical protein
MTKHFFRNEMGDPSFKKHMKWQARKPLVNGKVKYDWPPCINKFRSVAFYSENIIYLWYKTSYLYEEVNCTEPSLSISVPWVGGVQEVPGTEARKKDFKSNT